MDSPLASTAIIRRPAPPLAALAARGVASPASSAKPLATAKPADSGAPAAAASSPDSTDDGFGFLDVLSMLNPLQYLPVVGSFYRALTGDTIPEAVRDIGSLAISAVTGGPIGVAVSAAVTALEKLVGVDPDTLATDVLASLGIISSDSEPQLAASDTAAPVTTGTGTGTGYVPWTRAQRAAYRTAAFRPTIPAPSRHADIAAGAGVSAASEAAHRRAAADAYTRRTLSHIEPLIRERIAGHSA